MTALLIPAGMGYAVAAGLPPETGLYATIVPLLAYAVFGPSRILVLGPDSALAPIIAAAILPLALGSDDRAVALAGLLAIMVGVFLVLGGLLRLGFVTELLSKPIRVGYLNAIALLVIVSQVPKLLGFSIESESPLRDVRAILEAVADGQAQPLAVAFGVGSLIVIVALQWLRSPVPGVLVVVVGATAITAILGLSSSLPVVGSLPQGLPAPALAGIAWADVWALALPAAGIALVAFADSAVLSRTLAARRGESVDGSQEMSGIGFANIAGGLLGGFPVSASSSRTPVAEQAGSRTQLTGVVGAALLVAFILLAPGLTAFLPSATLAAVVIAAATSLIDVRGFVRLARMDKTDAALSVAAFLGVAHLRSAGGHRGRRSASRCWRSCCARGGRTRRSSAGSRGCAATTTSRATQREFGSRESSSCASMRRCSSPTGRCSTTMCAPSWPPRGLSLKTVILAAEPITDIDTTAMDELVELDDFLAKRGIRLILAEMKDPVVDVLRRHGLTERFMPDRFASTVGAAVDELTGKLRGDLDGTKWDDESDAPEEPPRRKLTRQLPLTTRWS